MLSIDAKKEGEGYFAFTHGGRNNSGKDAIEWAVEAEALGAGEILLNSIDRDGTRMGYDLELTEAISSRVKIPVIASGGAGTLQQLLEGVVNGKADAVLLASLLHYGEYTIADIKDYFSKHEVAVRW